MISQMCNLLQQLKTYQITNFTTEALPKIGCTAHVYKSRQFLKNTYSKYVRILKFLRIQPTFVTDGITYYQRYHMLIKIFLIWRTYHSFILQLLRKQLHLQLFLEFAMAHFPVHSQKYYVVPFRCPPHIHSSYTQFIYIFKDKIQYIVNLIFIKKTQISSCFEGGGLSRKYNNEQQTNVNSNQFYDITQQCDYILQKLEMQINYWFFSILCDDKIKEKLMIQLLIRKLLKNNFFE
eukprot:TRINITY_DN35110_c0_g1_i1.p2 TRINITY_DN35110_c0_g1~~TRINITY_DN35110_c0_g1_i1.p2  ORF type:complete len:235 (+),score=-25.07 TRINITY_DN35110_c0_g1_i1:385-1089(+)